MPVIMGLVPLLPPAMLLTMTDGHGVLSVIIGIVRVIILSGAADGHEVPQGAKTVDYCKAYQHAERFLHCSTYRCVCANSHSERREV